VTRIALLANPESGSGEADEAERRLRGLGTDVERFGLDQLDEAAASGAERIVVAGGDGSVGCAADLAARLERPLGVIPVGTANDFARALDLPRDEHEAARVAAFGERTRRLDLGRTGQRPFVNAVSAGLSPAAARKAHGLKRALGPLAYTVGALRAGVSASPIACRVRCDGSELFAGDAWQVTVACTGAFGGGAEVDTELDDGLLDVVAIEATSRARLILHAYGMRAGRVERQRGVIDGRGAEIEVDCDGSPGFNVDGELVNGSRVRATVQAQAFEVVVG
jgi:YegS/Rv2252/BmrU family lipid kinase